MGVHVRENDRGEGRERESGAEWRVRDGMAKGRDPWDKGTTPLCCLVGLPVLWTYAAYRIGLYVGSVFPGADTWCFHAQSGI